jgi:hypothetical protein
MTESDVCISLSITFRKLLSKFREDVHTANGHIRRLNIESPTPSVSRLPHRSTRHL